MNRLAENGAEKCGNISAPFFCLLLGRFMVPMRAKFGVWLSMTALSRAGSWSRFASKFWRLSLHEAHHRYHAKSPRHQEKGIKLLWSLCDIARVSCQGSWFGSHWGKAASSSLNRGGDSLSPAPRARDYGDRLSPPRSRKPSGRSSMRSCPWARQNRLRGFQSTDPPRSGRSWRAAPKARRMVPVLPSMLGGLTQGQVLHLPAPQ